MLPTAPPTTAPPATAPAGPTVPPLATDILVIYERSGCFAGIREQMLVYDDGTLELTDSKGATQTLTIPPDQLADLRDALAQPEFSAPQKPNLPLGADQCFYTIITKSGDSSRKIVTTGEPGDRGPIAQVVAILERLRGQLPDCQGRCQ
jgi:hypothetical protein